MLANIPAPKAMAAALPRGATRRTIARQRRRAPHRENPVHAPTTVLADRLGPLFVHARDALVVVEAASGRIVLWNSAAEHIFGYPADEIVGQPVDLLMPPAVARLQRERLAHYARTGEADVLNPRDSLSMPARTRHGDEIPIELSLAPLDEFDGSRHVLLTCRDASQEKLAELQALEAARAESARAETEAKLRQYEDLLHEGTRDLGVLMGRARRAAARLSLMAPPDATPSVRLALMARVVEARATAVQRTMEQIDNVASIQTGTFTLASERVNLVAPVTRITAEARARSRCHRFNLAAPQGLSAVCDQLRVEQVLQILIDQAVARNPRGCWIDVDLRRPLVGLASIEVRDYGRRLTDAERERLPSGETPDRQWYLCRYIVELHGGSLSIEFPQEGGTRVNVTLPTHGGRMNRA